MILSQLQNQGKAYSKMAGLIYLIIAVVGGFSIGYMPSVIFVEGNASATFQNLIENQALFRWGIAGDIAVILMEILLTVMIYQLFKPYSRTGILVATYSRIAMTIIMGMNLLNYMIPAIIISQPEYMSAFSNEQLNSLTQLFFNVHKYGEMAWQVFFAIHLFTLGYVIQKSGIAPKWLGITMLIGGIGYAGDTFIHLTLENSEILSTLFSSLLVLAVIGEIWFAIWLLVKGGKQLEAIDQSNENVNL
jgi:F0F1-type ATP synthase membrane subunit c/vacuolar-type H+-ATPase subunit K